MKLKEKTVKIYDKIVFYPKKEYKMLKNIDVKSQKNA